MLPKSCQSEPFAETSISEINHQPTNLEKQEELKTFQHPLFYIKKDFCNSWTNSSYLFISALGFPWYNCVHYLIDFLFTKTCVYVCSYVYTCCVYDYVYVYSEEHELVGVPVYTWLFVCKCAYAFVFVHYVCWWVYVCTSIFMCFYICVSDCVYCECVWLLKCVLCVCPFVCVCAHGDHKFLTCKRKHHINFNFWNILRGFHRTQLFRK